MADRLGDAGGPPQKQPRYAPIFVAASLTGLYTQRHVFHDPSNVVTARFYGGRPDVLWDGLNAELSNELTLIRRFGTSQFSAATYPEPPTCGYSFEQDDGSIQVIIDTPSFVYRDNQDGTKTTIFTKSAGAGQGYFVAAGSAGGAVLYYGDGIDLLKYTPWNTNGTSWNWGIASPAQAPGINTVSTGAASTVWQASSWYSTMGIIVDSNGNAQQLNSINADGTNTNANYGNTGNGGPTWNPTRLGTTTDGSITWINIGQITLWQPNTLYQPGAAIYDPVTNCIYMMSRSNAFTSNPTYPQFNGIPSVGPNAGNRTTEGNGSGCKWQCCGVVGAPSFSMIGLWMPSTAFAELPNPNTGITPSNGYPGYFNSAVVEPYLTMPPTDGNPQYLQIAGIAGGTSGTYSGPHWNTGLGNLTQDGQVQWMCLGSATWTANAQTTQWTANGSPFSVIEDSNSNLQMCIGSGTTGGSEPYPWATTYGAQTTDNNVTWVCLGPATLWPGAVVPCFLPTGGFFPPLSINSFGGASVIGSGYIQYVIQTGISGSSPPTWATAVGGTVDDPDSSGVVWEAVAPFSAATITLSWQFGYTYAYAYKCRAPNDTYVTEAPPGQNSPLGPYLGGGTGAISTASPVTTSISSSPGAVNTISGIYSPDPQVDTIVIYRSADGGGSANMFELTELPNIPSLGGQTIGGFVGLGRYGTRHITKGAKQAIWNFADFLPDKPTSQYPGLNIFQPAPINDSNDPPPTGFRPLSPKLHFSRIFGGVGNTVYFSGGPDVLTGNPNEAFDPTDEFQFRSTVIACIHTPTGLICPTTTDFECIYGGPSTASFYDTTMIPGVGMLSFNAFDIFGGEIYFVSSDSQFWTINPATQIARVGFAVGNKIAAFDASKAYVALHESGTDNAIYVGDGSTQWYRLNPHQVGADMSGENVAVWSPRAEINGGVQMLQSLVTAPGVHTLLIGGTGSTVSWTWVNGEVPIGSGTAFALAHTPTGPLILFRNEAPLLQGTDFTISGTAITLAVTIGSDTLVAFYAYGGTNPSFVNSEVPTGSGTSFALANAPTGLTILFRNEAPLLQGTDFTISGTSVSLATTIGSDTLLAFYSDGLNPLTFANSEIPTGSGTAFSLANTPTGMLLLFRNEAALLQGADFTISGKIITLATTIGSDTLLAFYSYGPTGGTTSQHIQKRDTTVYSDLGSPYSSWVDIGAITMVFPGQRAAVKFIECDFESVGTQPLVSYVLDNPSLTPTWNALTNYVYDPPLVYGGRNIAPTYWPDRFYLSQQAEVAVGRRIRIKVDFGSTDTVRNELVSFAVFGRKYVEQ